MLSHAISFFCVILFFAFIRNPCHSTPPPFFILTGGPGSGKTSLINELKKRGYTCVDETGRQIIQEQVLTGGDALPWQNRELFRDKMLERSIQDYLTHIGDKHTCFFDRGILDVIGYANLTQLEVTAAMQHAANQYRYNPVVFITPPWEEIYTQDTERKQSYQEAVDTYHQMVLVYRSYGYKLVEIPRTNLDERLAFILDFIAKLEETEK